MIELNETGENSYKLSGELTISNIGSFYKFLLEKIDQIKSNIVFDFCEVSSIDTSAIQLLVSFKKSLKVGLSVNFINLSGEVESTFKLMGLYDYFTMETT